LLFSSSRLSQKVGREQALPEDFVECGGKRGAHALDLLKLALSRK
jgi:hypothetical protein